MTIRNRVASAVVTALMIGAPAFAQSQIDNNQPVQGDLHAREASLQAKLTAAFDGGLLDSTELSAMQRDLDGILTRESDFRNRSTGLTSGGHDALEKSLDLFESRLNRHADKTANVTTSESAAVLGAPVSQTTVPLTTAPVAVIDTVTPVVPASTTVVEQTQTLVPVAPVLPSMDVVKQTTTTIESTDMAR
jgi:hypothetical protein